METWLEIVIRQLILYSLPVWISLTVTGWFESAGASAPDQRHPFHAIAWWGTWLPLTLGIAFHRGVIFALPQPRAASSLAGAARRLGAHVALMLIGLALYRFTLAHPPAAGLPPLHHWWAKVLMFFNLCMACLHVLPLPGMLAGEWFARRRVGSAFAAWMSLRRHQLIVAALAVSPLLDLTLGALLIFPLYERLASFARHMA